MANHRQPVDEEELRRLAMSETCRSEEIAASDALTHAPHSLVYSEYQRLVQSLRALRLKSHQSRIALRAHQHRRQDAKAGDG